jgi:CRISPR-associated endonuclease/helicase Cas3
MTASLPNEKLQAIKHVRPDLSIVSGPPELETLPRYLIDYSIEETGLWQAVEDSLSYNGKILWVRNRVEWANQTYIECRRRFPQVYCNVYHSRFRYSDRSQRHRQVIDQFKQSHGAAVLVSTQVAEMSLDLSADLLLTDIAPIPSLIQRMGRLNRFATPGQLQPKPAIIRGLPDEGNAELPYEKDEIRTAERWVRLLKQHDRALSQRDLSRTFSAVSSIKEYDLATAEQRACFFSGLWRTRPGQTRSEGYTASVILERDLRNCEDLASNGEPKRDWLREHEVPILFKEAILKWNRIGPLRIAPETSIFYDFDELTKEGTGAKWV